MGEFYKVNGEWWMPPVTNVDPITDYTKYCFSCKTQLQDCGREPCAGANCERFMFIECGHRGHLMSEDEDERDFPAKFFRCCDCKQASYQKRLFEEYMDELPRKNSATSRFSDMF